MANVGEYHVWGRQQPMAWKWASLATAATIVGVIRDVYGVRRSVVDSNLTQHPQHAAEHHQRDAKLGQETSPPETLATMVIVTAVAVAQRHPERCVHTQHTTKAQEEAPQIAGDLGPLAPDAQGPSAPTRSPGKPRRTKRCGLRRIRRRPRSCNVGQPPTPNGIAKDCARDSL